MNVDPSPELSLLWLIAIWPVCDRWLRWNKNMPSEAPDRDDRYQPLVHRMERSMRLLAVVLPKSPSSVTLCEERCVGSGDCSHRPAEVACALPPVCPP